ncbi:MAG: hypothetical protein L0J96_04505 [Lactococcus lactis]|uniref:hypothetical protein n=1 Tax=Lactococcus lactis TaxID=1358 RepID=UPI00071C719C|nr:hypothetical protein [Lactococcus lactis]MDN5611816.1 hypothetical protein [Staphylococcus equorum]MDN6424056.1 hypothetical protein [Tetragenococcus koreensis]ARE12012.1 hypothetical protein LLUC063_2205 [Lactococcus lactis subsp. lactis]KSU30673.1 hypothetical protein UC317_2476 [Lactococcus lactis subsp. lactis]MDN5425922.1 hypothetical protein [Lactococcus lactis]
MGVNRKCPKCGSTHVQLSSQKNKMGWGCLGMIFFGIFYFMHIFMKWAVGLMLFIFVDWYMAIIKAAQNKGYVWQSKKWFSGKKQMFFCHDCGNNFSA